MDNFASLLIPALLIFVLLRVIAMPIRLSWKLLLNSGCGFVCLWLLNSISGFTGVHFPVNAVTAVIAGFLGLPGIVLLALIQAII